MPQEPITLKISADVEGLNKALIDTAKKLDVWSKNAMGGFTDMAESVGKLTLRFSAMVAPVAAVGAAVYGLVKTTAEAGNEFLKLGQEVGVTVEDLSALKYAAEISDASFEALTTGLGFFSKSVTEAASGTGDAGRYFQAFGISVRDADGNLKSTRELILEVADVFSKMPDGAQKTAWAMQLFGRGGKELIPLLNEGKAGINDLMKEAERLGVVFSKDAAEAADRFGDNLVRLKANVMGLVYSIGNELIPAFNNLFDIISGKKTNWEKLDEVEKRIDLIRKKLKNLNENTNGGYGPSAYNADARERMEKELAALIKEHDAIRAELTHTASTEGKKEVPVSPEVLKLLEEYRIKLASVNDEKLKAIGLDEKKAVSEAGGEKALKTTKEGSELLSSIKKYYSGERFKIQSEDARSAFDALLKEELAYLEKSKTQEIEANKTKLAELEASYAMGQVTEKQYLDGKHILQAEAIGLEAGYAQKEKAVIEDVWTNKKALIKDEKERLKEDGDFKAEFLKRDEAIAKAQEELSRLGINYTVDEAKASEKLAEAKRQGELKVFEAEIEARKKLLSLARERGEKTDLDVKREELDLDLKIFQAQKQNLEVKRDALGVSEEEKATISSEIETINNKMQANTAEWVQATQEAYGTLWDGLKQGFTKYNSDTLTPAFGRGVDIAQESAKGMEQAFSDFFFDAMTGKLKSLWDYVKSFLESVARAMSNVLAQQTAQSIISGISGLWSSSSSTPTVIQVHSGGFIMHKGGFVPRFHFGGLSSDEVPAVLQKGEYVVSRKGVAALDAINSGNVGGGSTNVNVVVNNQTGLPLTMKQTGMKVSDRDKTRTILMDLIYTDPAFRTAIAGVK